MASRPNALPPPIGKQTKAKPQHHEQYFKLEKQADMQEDPDDELSDRDEPKEHVPKGATKSSLGRLSNNRHPQHGCPLVNVEPYRFHAKHCSIRPRSLRPKEADDNTEVVDEATAQVELGGVPEEMMFEFSVEQTLQDIERCEELAIAATGIEEDPVEDDIFGLCDM